MLASISTFAIALATEGKKGGLPQLNVNDFAPQLIWLAATFIALYFLMSKVALPKVGSVLEERAQRIQRDLDEAARLKGETEKALADYEASLASARSRAGGIAKDIRDKLTGEVDAERTRVEKQVAAQVADAEKRAAAEKATIDKDLAEAQELLDKLKEEERQALLSRGSGITRLPSDVPASGRAAAAVRYAMAQVGDAYVYGAAGPNAFDCSGLTMMAWAQAGVGLPHSSGAQAGSGPHVSSGNLRPGDLVFYYSPISHVGIYIGNGLIVHAANPGAGVRVAGVFSMPYSGAVRPG
jgi:cell wall-associated NlpC family hydrolase